MKKYFIAGMVAGILLGGISLVSAAPTYIFQRGIRPETDSTYDIGTNTSRFRYGYFDYVSSTAVSGDTVCIGGDCQTSFPTNFAWTPTTNYGALANSTSTPLWLQNGLQVSSTLYGSANNLTLNSVASPSINTVQNFFNLYSAGIRSGGVMTDNGDGTVTVSESEGLIAIGPLATDPLVFYKTAASSSIPMGTGLTHIGIEYNGGSPRVTTSSADDWTYQDDFPIGAVAKDNGVLHLYQNERRIADIPGQLIRRFHQTLPYSRDELVGGLLIGETGTRNVTLSAGYLFDRSNRFEISATSTATGGFFDAYYRDAGSGFTAVYNQTQWPNTQYDNGTGTLATLNASKYANLWWYLTIDGDVVMLYGRNEFANAAAAALASPPATVPPRLQFGARLIARTTFQKSASTWTANDSVWSNTFTASAVTNHANLSNLDYASAGHTGFAGTDLAAAQNITYVSSTAMSATTFIGNLTGTASQCTAADSDSTWTLHNSYPAACSAGQYASAIGDTLTCSEPAKTDLSNLASVAINTSLLSDTNNTDDLGAFGLAWKSVFSSTTAWLTAVKVAGTLEVQDKLIPKEYTIAFTYNTSTAWTGTTTIYLAPSASDNGITFTKARCETDTGTTKVSLYDGTNRADIINASTTIGKFNFSTNNIFNDAESIRVDVGTPATSPTWTACRFKYTYSP